LVGCDGDGWESGFRRDHGGQRLRAGCAVGKLLWRFLGNGAVFAGPSYLSHGKQLVTLAVGDVLMTSSLDGE